VLEQETLSELDRMDSGPLSERILEIIAEASALGLSLDLAAAKPRMQVLVNRALETIAAGPTPETVMVAQRLVEDAGTLGLRFGLWQAQNRFFEIWQARPQARPVLRPLGEPLGFNLTGEPA
jgi:hypothetical protein